MWDEVFHSGEDVDVVSWLRRRVASQVHVDVSKEHTEALKMETMFLHNSGNNMRVHATSQPGRISVSYILGLNALT
jgi:hypothetical protein